MGEPEAGQVDDSAVIDVVVLGKLFSGGQCGPSHLPASADCPQKVQKGNGDGQHVGQALLPIGEYPLGRMLKNVKIGV